MSSASASQATFSAVSGTLALLDKASTACCGVINHQLVLGVCPWPCSAQEQQCNFEGLRSEILDYSLSR